MAIYSEFSHQKLWFSIFMLVYIEHSKHQLHCKGETQPSMTGYPTLRLNQHKGGWYVTNPDRKLDKEPTMRYDGIWWYVGTLPWYYHDITYHDIMGYIYNQQSDIVFRCQPSCQLQRHHWERPDHGAREQVYDMPYPMGMGRNWLIGKSWFIRCKHQIQTSDV